MADDKAARDAKADALWSEVVPESTDVKALINSVQAALKLKQERNTKVSKKDKRRAKVNKTPVVVKPEAPKIDLEKARVLDADLTALEDSIDAAINVPRSVTPILLRDVRLEATRLKAVSGSVYGRDNVLGERFDAIDNSIASLSDILVANQEKDKADAAARRAAVKRALVGAALRGAQKGVTLMSKGANRARELLAYQRGQDTAPAEIGYTPVSSPTGPSAPVLAAPPEQRPASPSAKSLKEIAKNTKTTGQIVAKASMDSLKWIGKHLKNLSSSLFRFIKSPFKREGGLGDLLGMGILATSLIKPMLDGVHAELKRQFGDDYVEKFIKGLWDKSWDFLVRQVKGFLGIKTEEERAVEYSKQADKASAVKQAAEAAYQANPTPENKKALETASKEESRTKLAATFANPETGNNIVTVLNAKLDLYKNLKGPRKTQSKTNIQNIINEEVGQSALPKELAASLAKEGFKVPPAKIATEEKPSQIKPVVSAPVSSAAPAASVVASAPTMGTAEAAPVSAPMESAGPVTAKPAPAGGATQQEGGTTGYGGGGGSPTPGVAQVPTYMSDEPMQLFNSYVLTG